MTFPKLLRSAAAGGALVLSVGACGDDDPKVTATVPGATGSITNKIEVKDFRFNPETTSVKSGATVTWTFADDTEHTVEPVDPSSGLKASSRLLGGATYEAKLTKVGTIEYRCGIHVSMTGSIAVTS